jgi:hypothetical protein
MNKVPTTRFFYKSFKDLLKGKLTAREVLIYGIIDSFSDNPNGCFISRADIAERINESEATAERSLQLLISEGYVKARRQGRKRYLSTAYPQKDNLYQVDTNQVADLYQDDTQSVSKQGSDLYQVDTLLRSTTQIQLPRSNTKIHNSGSKYQYVNVWDEAKQAMVRKRVAY